MAHLGQVSELVGVQQQFLQAPSVAVDLIGHVEQRAVAFIDHLDMTVAPPQGYTVKHHGGGGLVVVADKSAPRAINKQQTGGRGGVVVVAVVDATDCSGGTVANTSEAKLPSEGKLR